MKMPFLNFLTLSAVKFTYIFLLIKTSAFMVKKNGTGPKQLQRRDKSNSISLARVSPYFSEETIILEDNELKKISHENNKCIKAIKDHKYLNNPLENVFKIDNTGHITEMKHQDNIYMHTKRLFKNVGYELCKKILTFNITISKELCEFDTYNNYILYINYLKDVKIEMIKDELEIRNFFFVKLPRSFDLDESVANFTENDYYVLKGKLENDFIKFDFSDIILNQVCPKANNKKDELFDEKNSNENLFIEKSENIIKFALITSHTLSEILIFPSNIKHVQYVKEYKNLKNIVKLKKSTKREYTQWAQWSPCYNTCTDNFAYKCRQNKCVNEDESFCDKHFLLKFQECPPTQCQKWLEGISRGKKKKNSYLASYLNSWKKIENKFLAILLYICNFTAEKNDDVKEDEKSEAKKEIIADSDEDLYENEKVFRRRPKRTNFFMWIINSKMKLKKFCAYAHVHVHMCVCVPCAKLNIPKQHCCETSFLSFFPS
ncbi:conserved Plasmodium protein, unknown function [Plasmodium ovale]|uniref:Uncharacterized protein n=1 Tax=Plasmodium ovale TaxID=36330 RepID=A0A1C3L599_PLAOA|nr:conserved Plasmodium protein, unknown function [Plasmodium ovale]